MRARFAARGGVESLRSNSGADIENRSPARDAGSADRSAVSHGSSRVEEDSRRDGASSVQPSNARRVAEHMSGKWNNSMSGLGRTHLSPLPASMRSEGDGPHVLHAPVLVLNASYEPINVCAARRAIVLVLKGIAMTEEENGHFLHAARLAIRLPSVIRL